MTGRRVLGLSSGRRLGENLVRKCAHLDMSRDTGASLAFTYLERRPQTWQERESYICSSGGCLVGDLDFRQQFW